MHLKVCRLPVRYELLLTKSVFCKLSTKETTDCSIWTTKTVGVNITADCCTANVRQLLLRRPAQLSVMAWSSIASPAAVFSASLTVDPRPDCTDSDVNRLQQCAPTETKPVRYSVSLPQSGDETHIDCRPVKVVWHEAASPPSTDRSVVFSRWRLHVHSQHGCECSPVCPTDRHTIADHGTTCVDWIDRPHSCILR